MQNVSRRTALKGIGVGAAVAWATPAVLSVASPAFAGSTAVNCPSGAGCEPASGGNCSATHPCGPGCTTGTDTANIGCYGVTDTEGNCFCAQGVNGCGATGAVCTASSECGPGQHCVIQSCCGAGHCYDCCGVNCH
jgi:hypothetical protein